MTKHDSDLQDVISETTEKKKGLKSFVNAQLEKVGRGAFSKALGLPKPTNAPKPAAPTDDKEALQIRVQKAGQQIAELTRLGVPGIDDLRQTLRKFQNHLDSGNKDYTLLLGHVGAALEDPAEQALKSFRSQKGKERAEFGERARQLKHEFDQLKQSPYYKGARKEQQTALNDYLRMSATLAMNNEEDPGAIAAADMLLDDFRQLMAEVGAQPPQDTPLSQVNETIEKLILQCNRELKSAKAQGALPGECAKAEEDLTRLESEWPGLLPSRALHEWQVLAARIGSSADAASLAGRVGRRARWTLETNAAIERIERDFKTLSARAKTILGCETYQSAIPQDVRKLRSYVHQEPEGIVALADTLLESIREKLDLWLKLPERPGTTGDPAFELLKVDHQKGEDLARQAETRNGSFESNYKALVQMWDKLEHPADAQEYKSIGKAIKEIRKLFDNEDTRDHAFALLRRTKERLALLMMRDEVVTAKTLKTMGERWTKAVASLRKAVEAFNKTILSRAGQDEVGRDARWIAAQATTFATLFDEKAFVATAQAFASDPQSGAERKRLREDTLVQVRHWRRVITANPIWRHLRDSNAFGGVNPQPHDPEQLLSEIETAVIGVH